MKHFFTLLTILLLSANMVAQESDARSQTQERGRQGGFAGNEYSIVYDGPDVVFRQVDEHLWIGSGRVMSSETLYIVEGETKAILIDAGTKIPGLKKIVEGITSKPIELILTHVHPDHAGECDEFDSVWLVKEDEDMLANICPDFRGEVKYIANGQKFDLGGRTLEAVYTPGHTLGAVTFMDKKHHYGFSGDSFGNGNLLLFSDFSTMIATCDKTLEWMQANDIYFLYNGHFSGNNHETTKRIYDLKILCEDLLSGKVQGEKNEGGLAGNMAISRNGIRVNYSEDKLK